jgi:hypothetical protein
MSASPLNFLRAGPPPPRVVLLPDGLFFVRAVPVAPASEAAEVMAQAELALEAASPFPPEQLYQGFFWTPGAERALVFAAYRRRFTSEQTAAWTGAEFVLPAFAAVLGAAPGPATSVVLAAPEGLTLIHWDSGPVPARVAFHAIAPEATDEDRAQARHALLRLGESRAVIDLAGSPAAEPSRSDEEVAFRSGNLVSRFSAAAAAALDVRDKGELAAMRGNRRRDVILWRAGLGCLAACGILLLGELALVGGGLWQKTRLAAFKAQAPVVADIKAAQGLANYIEDLSAKRLLPMEMISIVAGPKPQSVQFMSATAGTSAAGGGIYTLTVEAQTNNTADVSGYQTALQALPAVASADVSNISTRNNIASLTLTVKFKPTALKPAAPAS